ncbi:hypothetical protein BKA70DRAFT_307704 [Coprinopsis sp. MPI-PUGE-AT-0042]|nr:hypothetical protein BKA70DRAFT_307704 [Coprinopsis sp. MPI-PUGE-AT-0042]
MDHLNRKESSKISPPARLLTTDCERGSLQSPQPQPSSSDEQSEERDRLSKRLDWTAYQLLYLSLLGTPTQWFWSWRPSSPTSAADERTSGTKIPFCETSATYSSSTTVTDAVGNISFEPVADGATVNQYFCDTAPPSPIQEAPSQGPATSDSDGEPRIKINGGRGNFFLGSLGHKGKLTSRPVLVCYNSEGFIATLNQTYWSRRASAAHSTGPSQTG